jgi:hypothetical protein
LQSADDGKVADGQLKFAGHLDQARENLAPVSKTMARVMGF